MKNVVIIGAGYGGLRAAEHLCKNSELSITLIDQNPYHYMQTEAYGYIAGRFDFQDIAIDIDAFVKGLGERVRFVKGRVVHLNEANNNVLLQDESHIAYDYLIIAVGARTNFFSFIKGARQYTYGVKNIERAFGFRQAFEKRLYKKLQAESLNRAGDLHIAIAGAGLSGVEIAAEMAYMLDNYKKILPQTNTEFQISLIDAAPTILPGMDPYIIEETKKRLDELHVDIYTNAFIDEIEERRIHFQDGSKLDFDFIIYTAGIKGNDLVNDIACETNRQNQIITDAYLNIPGRKNIFAIGDCAQIKDKAGTILPPTAQVAEKSAAYVAKSIQKIIQHQAVDTFNAKVDGVFVALGGEYALGVMYDKIKVKGYLAYLLKKLITRFYRLGLELKVNAGYKKRGNRL